MQYLDTCGNCLTADSPAITPIKITPNGPSSILATYRCPHCHDVWTCGWAANEEEPAA